MFSFVIRLVSFILTMDRTDYDSISSYHRDETILNTCIDNLSQIAFIRKLKRHHFSDGVHQNGRSVVSASKASETLKHIHDIIFNNQGATKEL